MYPVVLATLSLLPSALAYCPPASALLPPPVINTTGLSSAPAIPQDVLTPWRGNTTSFMIKASIGNTTILTYDYFAPRYKPNTTKAFDTQLRIGSFTKTYTVLAVLLSEGKIGWDDPIRKFVPKLCGKVWDDVTISSLAGHTAGLGRFGYVGDLSFVQSFNPKMLGIPAVNKTLPGCDPAPGGPTCSYDQVIDMFNSPSQKPRSPNGGPIYSNIAYTLLGMALEKAHSKTFDDIVADLILKPLDLNKSTFIPPTNRNTAIIPLPEDKWMYPNFEHYNPTGGLWQTPNELHIFLRAILDHKFLSPAATRKWFQPRQLLPSLNQLVGAPWEILRPSRHELNLTFPRTVDIYTKSGGVPGYVSLGILVPEFDLAVSFNAAGNLSTETVQALLGPVLQTLIPYADNMARNQAESEYAGTYSLPGTNSSITFTLDKGPGLSITSFVVNGAPVLAGLAAIQRGGPPKGFSVRVYPSDPDSLGTEKEFWWMSFDTETQPDTFAENGCAEWFSIDLYRYIGESLDAIHFVRRGGKVVGVELIGWRTTLNKVA